ncbi:hypothetical protein vseg_020421 [Gypsophila vaccaria]
MVKKSKESSKNSSENPNIFNKLFSIEQSNDNSQLNPLFSAENPFRRKKIEENPQIDPNPNPKITEIEKIPNLSTPKSPKTIKKSKEAPQSENPSSRFVGKVNSTDEKEEETKPKTKKNKRKRDELEREYEAKKYGIVGEEKVKVKVKVGKKRKAVDNENDTTVAENEDDVEEGYDDEGKLLRTVFVGNLPLKVKKKVLIKEFSRFGEVVSVRIRSIPTLDSKKPKKAMIYSGKLNEMADSVHAYIVFKTEQAAEASLANNMSVIGGNHIRVDRACPPRKKLKGESASTPLYSSKRTVFVGNLPFDVKDEELYKLFCGMKELESSIEAVRVIRDPHTSLGKGIAYVLFKTREAANLLCKKRKVMLRDRELRISHAKSETKSTPSKSEDSSTPYKRKGAFPEDSESTPVKKLSSGGRTRPGRYKLNASGDTSYQGFQASKSGDKKRTPSRSSTPASFKPKTGEKVKQRSEKRPSVAARKAKTLATALRGGVTSKQSGNKRKMDARTPQSSDQKKKFRKSK